MSLQAAGFTLHQDDKGQSVLQLSGNWLQGALPIELPTTPANLASSTAPITGFTIDGSNVAEWDSAFVAYLLRCHDSFNAAQIPFQTVNLPAGSERLLKLASAVKAHETQSEENGSWLSQLHPAALFGDVFKEVISSLTFIGDVMIALGRLITGKANTRLVDFWNFCYQAGPDAFAIISLTSVLVGMILAYLGAVQLQQFGAEIYVADLVVIGMLREMGVLMTAIVMSGRTGAAYAAALGTMQTNDEIDAIITMGVSPMEFLVIPRMLALIVVMPLLTIYADVLGIIGGAIVAYGMDISPTQYLHQAETAVAFTHVAVGMIKSVVFGTLIAIAGCQAGINSGRSSAAVGQAATRAVVTAIVYLIIADASINIIFQQLDL